jgi:ATP-dependent DNA ligase
MIFQPGFRPAHAIINIISAIARGRTRRLARACLSPRSGREEGIAGKHLDQPYRSGRTGDWIKIKCVQSEAFMVVGYETSTASPSGLGSLVHSAYRGNELVHVGSVGTGFKEAVTVRLRKMLGRLRWKRKQPPVPYSGKADIVWFEPTLSKRQAEAVQAA